MNTLPFLGRGLAFPFRLNESTGGAAITEGQNDNEQISFAYLLDRWTIREKTPDRQNHIAEAITNILLTRKLEHDTLPEYGSNIDNIIFDPNTDFIKNEFEVWLKICTERWEKRAFVPLPWGLTWLNNNGEQIDRNELPVNIFVEILEQQHPKNLVTPFVQPEYARNQEYPTGKLDEGRHDWLSRYRGFRVYNDDGTRYIRFRKTKKVKFRPDDKFYKVKHNDSWLLIGHKTLLDHRLWWIIFDYYVADCAARGESRESMDAMDDPPFGKVLRYPSRERVLTELIK